MGALRGKEGWSRDAHPSSVSYVLCLYVELFFFLPENEKSECLAAWQDHALIFRGDKASLQISSENLLCYKVISQALEATISVMVLMASDNFKYWEPA